MGTQRRALCGAVRNAAAATATSRSDHPISRVSGRKDVRGTMSKLRTGVRYAANLTSMVARQEGVLAAAVVGTQFVATEAAKLPRAASLALRPSAHVAHPPLISDVIVADLS